ncbi:unnamed protein product [Calypogeia fissa]
MEYSGRLGGRGATRYGYYNGGRGIGRNPSLSLTGLAGIHKPASLREEILSGLNLWIMSRHHLLNTRRRGCTGTPPLV